ncbi:Tn3 family transposase [Plantibacter sp. RU18]|uniref:Tn3 family transposase n=1 Tax=Plantibacter sp. RU18 TaxID=3158143 RepID=UPI003D35AAC6
MAALDRAADLEALRVREVDCTAVPANRLAALARYGMASKAPTLNELAEPRRTATLVALARYLDAVAVDDVLDLFAVLMTTKLLSPAQKATSADRLSWLPRLEKASRVLASVNSELLTFLGAAAEEGGGLDVAAVWARIESIASRELIAGAVATVVELVPDDDNQNAAFRVALSERYRTVRPFVQLLCESSSLAASPAGGPVLAAVRAVPALLARRVGMKPLAAAEIHEGIVPSVWRRAVFDPDTGDVDRDAYVVCVLEQLHKALRVRDVFATCSHRWADPRARLLVGPAWESVRPEILNGLGLDVPVDAHLSGMVSLLDATWLQAAARLEEAGEDARVKIVPAADGRARLSVERLEALEIPDSLTWLKATTASMLPAIDLPELLLEVHAWTGFLDAYVHVSGADTRLSDLAVTVAALLIADGCNVGLTPVTNPAVEAL